ncbi:MAG: ORF6C domain-containing protein [Anaerolineales bacterium]|nr:ORF6C domain-containing protein [Anaerolineales bacterium]MCA9930242.1 ORF6C domain-containing protein [Anaerolineales bacterium]
MSKDLTVIEQREVAFYDDQLTAVRGQDGRVYVSIRHMCDALGVDRRGQMRRIRDNDVLAEGYTRGGLSSPPSPNGRGGGIQQAALLRVDLVPLWLAGISPNRVKDDIREKLTRFQKEAAAVLWEAFQDGRLTADPDFDALLQSDSDAVQAYKMLQALVKLARNQIILESRLDAHDLQMEDYGRRLETIESQLSPPAHVVTQSQAMQISQAVKAVAIALGKQTKRNEFGSVYGELYRKFEITSYKLLPAARFDDCMAWLTEWHQSLTSDEAF